MHFNSAKVCSTYWELVPKNAHQEGPANAFPIPATRLAFWLRLEPHSLRLPCKEIIEGICSVFKQKQWAHCACSQIHVTLLQEYLSPSLTERTRTTFPRSFAKAGGWLTRPSRRDTIFLSPSRAGQSQRRPAVGPPIGSARTPWPWKKDKAFVGLFKNQASERYRIGTICSERTEQTRTYTEVITLGFQPATAPRTYRSGTTWARPGTTWAVALAGSSRLCLPHRGAQGFPKLCHTIQPTSSRLSITQKEPIAASLPHAAVILCVLIYLVDYGFSVIPKTEQEP